MINSVKKMLFPSVKAAQAEDSAVVSLPGGSRKQRLWTMQ